MQNYKHLTIEQRYQIEGLLKANFKQAGIARELGVSKSTISREIKRNRGQRGYRPKQANELSCERRGVCKNAQKFSEVDWQLVKNCLQEKMSPEQVSGRLLLCNQLEISHEAIYQYIYRDKRAGGTLASHLRSQKRYRKRYGSGKERRGVIKNRVSIEQRPAIVAEKNRIGDWEGDTIIGKDHQGALVTLVDRCSRYTLCAPVASKHAEGVAATMLALLMPHKARCHTITLDNGKEFASHESVAAQLEVAVYFAHPYHSWERGVNENTNGLIRQYFPKNTNLKEVTSDEVNFAINQINHRPRKCLGFRTPYEVFFDKHSTWHNTELDVALRI